MIWLCLLVVLAALALFGLADPVHHRRRFGAFGTPRRARWMRALGWVAVLVALPLAIAARGPVFGPVFWIGLLMLAAGAVWLALNLLPDRQGKHR
ncbi:hypothetical protein GCM10007973_26630 [Polymorphobacter multimanifer]|uniref:Putative membrane channel-forming protein YqfA (Hemolysin III family) n=1 Tax=Polymorphobacter multimanifer TaxID=1070431 RepID=A0A841LDJ7_9SPHN|nr:DUF3325 domain-containing protein [Polymorphobacter multimanifer]MBB6229083.1 putative membrane channel-forming protein YqfA (hemolysin III family) [Polymorphobacter multimanifer]GGI88952.1 hypothetical protein GCM10007973_26630 [Polymorphobacter multimanifer]